MTESPHDENDEAARALFAGLRPKQPGPELRERVLAAVDRELNRPTVPPRFSSTVERIVWRSLAMAMVLAIAANGLVYRWDGQRISRLASDKPVPSPVAAVLADIETTTGRPVDGTLRKVILSQYHHRPRADGKVQGILRVLEQGQSLIKELGT